MIIVRQTTAADAIGIRRLFHLCFGKEMSDSEWRWKYEKSHLGSSSFLAEDDGNIIAHYGGIKMRFHSNGKTSIAYQGCDVMTHPDYRAKFFSKRGIVVKISEAFYDANPMDFIFGFPSERHGKLMTLQLKWEPHRIIRVLKKESSEIRRRRNLFLSQNKDWDRFSPQQYDRLWSDARNSYDLSIEKDSRYVLWRYRDNPRLKYEIVSFRGFLSRDAEAVIIYKIENDNLFVLDFIMTRSINQRRAVALIDNLAVKTKARSISIWMNPREPLYGVFRDYGYREEQDIPYSVRIFQGSAISGSFFMDRYCYRHGDYDAA